MPLSKIVANSITDNTITTDQIADTSVHGRRNLVINGACQISSRGTSFNNISSDTFVVDRFFVSHGNVTPNVSQQTVAVGGETGLPVQFTKFARCDFDVNGGSNLGIHTRLEDTEKYVGTHTVSFYAKGTNPTGGQMAVRFIQRFGSGGSSQVITDPSGGLFTLTSNWQRFSVTVTLPSVSGKTLGSGRYLQLQITQPNADSGTGTFLLDITGVQLEVGEKATPFEHRSFGDELARCLRYYHTSNIGDPDGSLSGAATGIAFDANEVSVCYEFPVPMRATPTVTLRDNAGNTARVHRMRSGDHGNSTSAGLINKTGFSNFASTGLTVNAGYLGGVEADAEL